MSAHARRRKPHELNASALIAAYVAAHPTSTPATWSRAVTQDAIPTDTFAAPVAPTNPVLSILRPSAASL